MDSAHHHQAKENERQEEEEESERKGNDPLAHRMRRRRRQIKPSSEGYSTPALKSIDIKERSENSNDLGSSDLPPLRNHRANIVGIVAVGKAGWKVCPSPPIVPGGRNGSRD